MASRRLPPRCRRSLTHWGFNSVSTALNAAVDALEPNPDEALVIWWRSYGNVQVRQAIRSVGIAIA